MFKGTTMHVEKEMINDHLIVTKISWNVWIPTIYNFAVITREFSIYKEILWLYNRKTRTDMNSKISVFVISTEAIKCFYIIYMTVPLNNVSINLSVWINPASV